MIEFSKLYNLKNYKISKIVHMENYQISEIVYFRTLSNFQNSPIVEIDKILKFRKLSNFQNIQICKTIKLSELFNLEKYQISKIIISENLVILNSDQFLAFLPHFSQSASSQELCTKRIIFFIAGLHFSCSQKNIPEYLRECYENSTIQENRMPMNLRVLIDLIRKAERHSETSMDMRSIAVSLLHRFLFYFCIRLSALNF